MLNIVGSKFNTNKENNVGVYVAKLDDSARKHPVKKQPFNALQNVMHNQAVTTPFKNGSNHNHNSAKLLQYSQPRKQFGQDFTTKPQPSFSAQISDMDILLDSFDIDRPCCRKPFKGKYDIFRS
uniref:Uncharacterized protein n=1 Tax=Glossina brevipalpis TaxID=37001 RepID=A0A1A9WJ32_9MUSC